MLAYIGIYWLILAYTGVYYFQLFFEEHTAGRLWEQNMFYLPKRSSDVAMFFSTKINTADAAEMLHVIDPIISCGEMLRRECCIKNSYHSADNISFSYSQFIKSWPAE